MYFFSPSTNKFAYIWQLVVKIITIFMSLLTVEILQIFTESSNDKVLFIYTLKKKKNKNCEQLSEIQFIDILDVKD